MASRRIVALALATQAALVALAWWATRALDRPVQWGDPVRDAAIGVMVAVALAVVNYTLLTRAPDVWLVRGVRRIYRDTLVPLFRDIGPLGVIALGAAAGLGEEWFFRGLLQPLIGLPMASILFGAAHVAGAHMFAFGAWATAMGLIMGLLTIATGGLTAAVVAHGVYDMLALEYIRRGGHTA